ncbi:MAG TPA: hypothetical protein VI643_01855 [Planctomycetota bacterium]|nr:hypothetical protein [Planctomycetota bacterium]
MSLDPALHAFLDPSESLYAVAAAALLTVIIVAVMLGLQLLAVALMPSLSERASSRFGRRHLLSFLCGLGALVLAFVFVGVGHAAPVIGVAGLALMTPVYILGFVSASETLGRRLCFVAGRESSRPMHLLIGWPVLALTACIPILGWLIGAYAVTAGMGSVILGLFSKEDL